MYKGKTPIYQIPYLKKGDKIRENVERQRALAIENLLFAGNCGMPKVIFEDGDYDIYKISDKEYVLTIMPEKTYAVLGILNHRLFYSYKTVVFEKLKRGEFYYVYLAYQSDMNTDATKFRRVLSPTRKDSNKYILLATVDLRGDEPVVDENPDGKKYTKDILAHITDSTNPHGRDLHQDRLSLHDWLKIDGNDVYGSLYFDCGFENQDCFIVDCDREVVFVNIMPLDKNSGFWIEVDGKRIIVHANNGGYSGRIKLEVKVK